jgi:putative zinc finger protein
MNCDDIQQSLSLYVDDGLTAEPRLACYQHLEVCPVCREHVVELRKLRSGLAMLSQPAPPADLVSSINLAVAAEAARQKAYRQSTTMDRFNDWAVKWVQPRPMRYAFSSFASIIIFTCVFAALRPHMIALHEATLAFEQMQLTEPDDYALLDLDITKPISPESYAALRTPFNSESPSLNPRGALASLGSQAGRLNGRQSDDDMVIVADVFLNGSASVAGVMQAPRDRRMLEDFQQALRKDAAFVPAAMDRRPETMRVVFSVQRVDVRESN